MKQIEKPKSLVWTEDFFSRWTYKDGETRIKVETRQCLCKGRDLYREVTFGAHGQIRQVRIKDFAEKRQMVLDPGAKQATVGIITKKEGRVGLDYTFGFKESLNAADLRLLEKRETPSGEVNVFRHAFKDRDGRNWSYDFCINAKTGRLVGIHVPGADIFNPETEASYQETAEKEWVSVKAVASIRREIEFDAELEDSLFKVESPRGYSVKSL